MAICTTIDRMIRRTLPALALLAAVSQPGRAANWSGAPGLFQVDPAFDPNDSALLTSLRTVVGGWINAGYTYNSVSPPDGFNGPVTFNDRARTFQLNQLYGYVERSVDVQGGAWDLGGRFDFVFGTDAAFTQAFGDSASTWDVRLLDNRFYQIAFPEAYVELFAPIERGVTVKLGHFYTIIGSESVMAPDNFFYSHSYTMQYGEPFTHTGALASYSPLDEFVVTLGAVTGSQFGGWDGAFDRSLENWGFLGGMTWASSQGTTSVSLNGTQGTVRQAPGGDVGLYSLVVQHDVMGSLHYRIQHDYGWLSGSKGGSDAAWYGIVQYLTFDLDTNVEIGLRAEWFRDNGGIRVQVPAREPSLGPNPASYYAVTGGINWRPLPWLSLRQNLRYDWSDGSEAYDAGQRSSQLLVSWDMLLLF